VFSTDWATCAGEDCWKCRWHQPGHDSCRRWGAVAPEGLHDQAVPDRWPLGWLRCPLRAQSSAVDYASLQELGTIPNVAPGGPWWVMDHSTNMVGPPPRSSMELLRRDESCGSKCVPCRAGTVQLHGVALAGDEPGSGRRPLPAGPGPARGPSATWFKDTQPLRPRQLSVFVQSRSLSSPIVPRGFVFLAVDWSVRWSLREAVAAVCGWWM